MSGNSFGVLFKVTTWGESHGPAVGAVVDGCPPNIGLSEGDIQADLDRRRPGLLPSSSPRREGDQVEILSGTFEGMTTGTPIALLIRNRDVDSGAYEELRNVFRPGHADFTYYKKYGIRDHRGGGRASARETAARVAAGGIAKKVLAEAGITVLGYTVEIGGVSIDSFSPEEIARNSLLCPDPDAAKTMLHTLQDAREQGDSLGGIVELRVTGCPAGLGEPVFDKMDADIAKALMSIGSIKGVEVGAGFGCAGMTGSEANDALLSHGFATNHAGGILGGITNGDDIVVRVACKPIPSIAREQMTVDTQGSQRTVAVRGKHDVCAIPRIIPVCEAMMALVFTDHLLRERAMRREPGNRPGG